MVRQCWIRMRPKMGLEVAVSMRESSRFRARRARCASRAVEGMKGVSRWEG